MNALLSFIETIYSFNKTLSTFVIAMNTFITDIRSFNMLIAYFVSASTTLVSRDPASVRDQ